MNAVAARSIRASSAHILVGRNDELALLDRLACQTLAGRAQVVTVEGLAGAGKTALVTEALRRSMPDAVVLHGRGGGAHAAPHLPLAMAMRSFGEGEAVARLLDGVVAERAAAPAEAGVADMVVDCLARGARQRRLAVVLEDLDRSDPATLGLVAYIGSRLADDSEERAHLLLLCTFRPGPRGGIDAAMRRLVALPSVTHLPLHPLSEPGVLQMLTDLLGAKPSRALLREAVRTSRGIPGRIHQLVTALVEVDGLVDRVGEVDLGVASVVLPLPRDDVRRAEATLTAMETVHRQLVITAALMGAGRPLEDLRAALRSDADTFEAGLEAAFAAGCLIDRDDRIAFCDPSFAEAVLHGIRPRQQRRLHAAIAANLAAAGAATTPGRIMLLAHHLAVAGPSEPRYRALFEIGRAAGSLAMANGDYSSAARYFEAALSAENGRASTAMVALLHLEAGIARFRDHDPTAALAHLRLAADGARSGGEPEVWGQAVLALSTMLTVNSNQSVGHDVGLELIREFLDARPAVDPGVRARVLQRLSQAQFASFAFDAALTTAEQAAAAAADSSDPTLLGDIGFAAARAARHPAARVGRSGAARKCRPRRRSRGPLDRGLGARSPALRDLDAGRPDRRRVVSAAGADPRAVDAELVGVVPRRSDGGRHLAPRGELGEVERHGSEAELLYRRSESGFTTVVLYPALACARTLRGDASSAHQALDAWAAAGVFGSEFFRLLVDAFDGVRQSGHELHGVVPAEESLLGLTLAALSVELGDLIDDEDLIAQGLPPLASALSRGVVCGVRVGASSCHGWSRSAAWRTGSRRPGGIVRALLAIRGTDTRRRRARTNSIRCSGLLRRYRSGASRDLGRQGEPDVR